MGKTIESVGGFAHKPASPTANAAGRSFSTSSTDSVSSYKSRRHSMKFSELGELTRT